MAAEINYELDGMKEVLTAINKLGDIGKKELKLEIKRTAEGIENHYRRDVKKHFKHHDEGSLDKSISHSSKDGWKSAETGSDVKHSIFIEMGTIWHYIHAKTKPYLVFFSDKVGSIIKKKWVQHPGTDANPALLNAFMDWAGANKFATRLRQRLDTYKL